MVKVKEEFVCRTQDIIFKGIHRKQLIYNACWEDPRLDRQLLRLNHDSRVVMITSAGCNVLDYLLDTPVQIHAVDVNPRQNALLHLKLSFIRQRHFEDLFQMFGMGAHPAYEDLYPMLRQRLPLYAQKFWDKKIHYFDSEAKKKSFYYHGTSGEVAWLFHNFLKANKRVHNYLFELLETRGLAEQRELYERIEPKLWNAFVCWLVKHPVLMAMVGVPRPQIELIRQQYPEGLVGFVRESLKKICTEVPVQENYFWRVYLTGSYTPSCCPNYLKEENFEHLRCNFDRIHTYNATLTEFLKCHPGPYSHFVLLDHQDWLAWHQPEALAEEWDLILQNSRPGAKILMRSAGPNLNFLPAPLRASLRFFPELTEPLHRQDRVGTYGSLHLAEVL